MKTYVSYEKYVNICLCQMSQGHFKGMHKSRSQKMFIARENNFFHVVSIYFLCTSTTHFCYLGNFSTQSQMSSLLSSRSRVTGRFNNTRSEKQSPFIGFSSLQGSSYLHRLISRCGKFPSRILHLRIVHPREDIGEQCHAAIRWLLSLFRGTYMYCIYEK